MSSRVAAVALACAAAAAAAAAVAVASAGVANPVRPEPARAAVRATSSRVALIGRWERVNTCQELLRALKRYGLGATAPAMLAGNGYIPGSSKQIARRRHPCAGAVARRHSHFFRTDGQFGSVDYHGNQVDDGPWKLVGARTVRIGSPPGIGGTFRVRIRNGRLHLTPLITRAQKRKALAHPLRFSSAGWMVAVSYAGHAWKRVPCREWC